jgi:hypothetical protein
MIKQLLMDAHELNFSPPIHEQLLTDANNMLHITYK